MVNKTLMALFIIGLIFLIISKKPIEPTIIHVNESGSYINANPATIDAGVMFTGQDKFKPGTSLSTETVKVIQPNSDSNNLGSISLDKGTLATVPGQSYYFYIFMNNSKPSTQYYVVRREYVAPVQDATVPIVGIGCKIDNSLVGSVYTSSDSLQTASANAFALGASESAQGKIKITVNKDKCYGMPDSGRKNALCFLYDGTYITKVETDNNWISSPYSISSSTSAVGKTVSCYEFPLMENLQQISVPLTITSGSNPTSAHNITVMSDDIAFDLNADNLQEIYDYVDEDGNELASNVQVLGYVRVS